MTEDAEYPVGRCDNPHCGYAEPHRHGFDCGTGCVCDGIGAITEPLGQDDLATCDWGYCNRESVGMRLERLTERSNDEVWLAVCAWHAGWLDEEPEDDR